MQTGTEGMPKIALVVMACNEPEELRRCLSSVGDIPAYVSVDAKSLDETLDVAMELAAGVNLHEFLDNSWAATRNAVHDWAESQTDADWFLCLDADEWVEEGLEHLPRICQIAEEREARAVSVLLQDHPAEEDISQGLTPGRWPNTKIIRRGVRYMRRRHECIPADTPFVLADMVVIGHRKTQRPEVIEACNRLKHDGDAFAADFGEFRDRRSAYYMGTYHWAEGDVNAALGWFHLALSIPDSSPGLEALVLEGIAMCYRHHGWHNMALAMSQRKLALGAPYLAEAACDMAQDSINSGNNDMALWWAQVALATPAIERNDGVSYPEKHRTLPHYIRAVAYHNMGRLDEAAEELELARETGVDRQQYRDLAARIAAAREGGDGDAMVHS